MLEVYFERYPVGTIAPTEEGPSFSYSPEWQALRGAFPVSLTMPLAEAEVGPGAFAPWAANLLPEAAQLTAIGRHLGVATGDVIGLLSKIGRDTAGALSFGAPGSTSTEDWRPIENEATLERIIEELPRKPFLAGEDGVSMSLAGVQSKIAVAVDSAGGFYIPLDGAPSTHILKPDADKLWGVSRVGSRNRPLLFSRSLGFQNLPCMDMRKNIGEDFAGLRREKGLTRHEAAELSGFSQAYIGWLERGHRIPTAISLWLLAQSVGAAPADLVRPPQDHD